MGHAHKPTPAPCQASCDRQTETTVWTSYLGIAPQNTKHTGLAVQLVSYILKWKRLTFPGSRPASPGTGGRAGSATRGRGPGCGARRSGWSPGSNTSTGDYLGHRLTSVPPFPCLQGGDNKPWLLWMVTEPPDWQHHFSDAETDQAQSQAPRIPTKATRTPQHDAWGRTVSGKNVCLEGTEPRV